tara:strand:+ start:289 stop:495 length:207 start_codon:yes stop_codon:yes gene_type:complete
MAKTKLLFCDSNDNGTLEVFWNESNEITLWLEQPNEYPTTISLDKQTSIKLVKTLKSEISKIEGGSNV